MRFACACFVFIFCYHLSTFVFSTYLSHTHILTLMCFYVGNFHEQSDEINQRLRQGNKESEKERQRVEVWASSTHTHDAFCSLFFFTGMRVYLCACEWCMSARHELSWVELSRTIKKEKDWTSVCVCNDVFRIGSHQIHCTANLCQWQQKNWKP